MRLAADQADDRHWLRQLDTADCDQDGGGCGQMMVMIVLQMIIIVVVMIVVVMVIMVGIFIMVVMMILVTYILIMMTCVCVFHEKIITSHLPELSAGGAKQDARFGLVIMIVMLVRDG